MGRLGVVGHPDQQRLGSGVPEGAEHPSEAGNEEHTGAVLVVSYLVQQLLHALHIVEEVERVSHPVDSGSPALYSSLHSIVHSTVLELEENSPQ